MSLDALVKLFSLPKKHVFKKNDKLGFPRFFQKACVDNAEKSREENQNCAAQCQKYKYH